MGGGGRRGASAISGKRTAAPQSTCRWAGSCAGRTNKGPISQPGCEPAWAVASSSAHGHTASEPATARRGARAHAGGRVRNFVFSPASRSAHSREMGTQCPRRRAPLAATPARAVAPAPRPHTLRRGIAGAGRGVLPRPARPPSFDYSLTNLIYRPQTHLPAAAFACAPGQPRARWHGEAWLHCSPPPAHRPSRCAPAAAAQRALSRSAAPACPPQVRPACEGACRRALCQRGVRATPSLTPCPCLTPACLPAKQCPRSWRSTWMPRSGIRRCIRRGAAAAPACLAPAPARSRARSLPLSRARADVLFPTRTVVGRRRAVQKERRRDAHRQEWDQVRERERE